MSPILVRPVREQLEHDRVIRLLQAKYKRKFEVGINPGTEQTAPVATGTTTWYPDLVLHSAERSRKLQGVVEVETAESVNNLEAMSQWAAFARIAPFHLYVPVASIDVARRLCADLRVPVAEVWAYHAIGEQVRFTLVDRAEPAEETPPAASAASREKPAAVAPPAAGNRSGGGTGAKASRAAPARPTRTATAAGAKHRAAGTKAKSAAPRRGAAARTSKSASGGSTRTTKSASGGSKVSKRR